MDEDHQCEDCGARFSESEVTTKDCPECGGRLWPSVFSSRGSMAEVLAEELTESEDEEEQDVYRALLHLLTCNHISKVDVGNAIYFSDVTDRLDNVLTEAYENRDQNEEGDVLVCPNCDERIKSWAKWFDEEHVININPSRRIR